MQAAELGCPTFHSERTFPSAWHKVYRQIGWQLLKSQTMTVGVKFTSKTSKLFCTVRATPNLF